MIGQIVPARWWEVGPFIRINLEMTRGRDPWGDRLLARPWAPAHMLEYLYMLDAFARFDNFLVKVAGQRAGVLALHRRPRFIYVYSLGLLPEFQRGKLGSQLGEFVRDYSRRHDLDVAVASVSVVNRPVHVLVRAFGGRLLGLSTTSLAVLEAASPPEPMPGLRAQPLQRGQVLAAWSRWRLHEVEQVAGPEAMEVAGWVLDKPPRARYLACFTGEEEVGLAYLRRARGGVEIGLFPTHELWGESGTLGLLAALARHVQAPVRRLTLTQTHADMLCAAWPGTQRFERQRDQERHLVFIRRR
jgi:ribosomal protein S18 acetylase RimI-like enzyme